MAVLLGGSSMAGAKATSNDQTISGHLERQLNASGDGRRYQVINAGVAGFYSSLESVYFTTELVHYKPSVVVVLDGFNDFWHSWSDTHDSADLGNWAIPNRSAEQQKHVAFFGGVKPRGQLAKRLREPSAFTRVFRYSSDLLASILIKIGIIENTPPARTVPSVPAELDPWPHNAAWLSTSGYGSNSHVPFMVANWQNIIGAASSRGMGAVILLQPFVPVAGRSLASGENEHIRESIDRKVGRVGTESDYRRESAAFYSDARKSLAELRESMADQPLIHIEDISTIFNEEPEPVFADVIHYTDRGNELLATHMAEIVKQLMKVRQERISDQ